MFNKSSIESIARTCNVKTDDPVLDKLFDTYNEGSPRDDIPVYYRFLRCLSELWPITNDGSMKFMELGCKYGAASLHVVKDQDHALAWAVDTTNSIKSEVSSQERFKFFKSNSTDQNFVEEFSEEIFDILMIDTDHSYETTAKEFELWAPKVKSGGIILFDDIDAPEYANGCGKFFRELSGESVSLPQLHPVNWGFGCWFKR